MATLPIHPGEPPRPGTCLFARAYPSRVDRKQVVLDEIARELLSRGWVLPEDEHWLALCLDEVVVNAMLHGNEGDPDLDITVALYHDPDRQRWVLLVSDLGDGFSAECLPDFDDPQSLLLEHGRGIRIMREWLDRLEYYRNGACALLARRCAGTAQ
jgi:anti-sigma regulatory factor (Ser/Thr protein kinase)